MHPRLSHFELATETLRDTVIGRQGQRDLLLRTHPPTQVLQTAPLQALVFLLLLSFMCHTLRGSTNSTKPIKSHKKFAFYWDLNSLHKRCPDKVRNRSC